MLLSFSDILLAVTLFINAGAVINMKFGYAADGSAKAKFAKCIATLQFLRYVVLAWNLIIMILIII